MGDAGGKALCPQYYLGLDKAFEIGSSLWKILWRENKIRESEALRMSILRDKFPQNLSISRLRRLKIEMILGTSDRFPIIFCIGGENSGICRDLLARNKYLAGTGNTRCQLKPKVTNIELTPTDAIKYAREYRMESWTMTWFQFVYHKCLSVCCAFGNNIRQKIYKTCRRYS